MASKIDWSVFRHPHFRFAEVVIASGARGFIDQHQLRVSRDTVIDYIMISEESYTTLGAGVSNNRTYLDSLFVNWSLVDRADNSGQGLAPVEEYHNFHNADRSITPFAAASAGWGGLRTDHTLPWIYNPTDTLTFEMSIPAAPALGGLGKSVVVDYLAHGVGLNSGLRRTYDVREITIPQDAAAPQVVVSTTNATASNLGTEAYKMVDFGVSFRRMTAAGAATNWISFPDVRYLNHLRLRVNPSLGESWSDVHVPLIFYGLNYSPPSRMIVHKPSGGPVLLKAGQSMVFEFLNASAVSTNVQVALMGRIAAGIGSVA